MTKAVILVALCSMAWTGTNAAEPCRELCVDGSVLSFFNSKKEFYQAEQECLGRGAHLVKIDNKRITWAINATIKPKVDGGYFTGAGDTGINKYKWRDGTKVYLRGESGYQNWKHNQPNNRGEKCLAVGRETPLWVDVYCNLRLNYICQKEITLSSSKTNPEEYTCDVDNACPDLDCTRITIRWTDSSGNYVKTSTGTGLYQTIPNVTGRPATLHLGNALFSESGEYFCTASYNGKVMKKDTAVQVNVNGRPHTLEAKRFSCNSSLLVSWIPNAAAFGFRHNITVHDLTMPGSREEKSSKPTSATTQLTQFTGLKSSTRYRIEVVPCTAECKADDTISKEIFTGGIPRSVASASITQTTTNCVVSWSQPADIPHDIVEKYKITLETKFVASRPETQKEKPIEKEIDKEDSSYPFNPLPNRRYNVKVQSASCAGSSEAVEASGTCEGQAQAPSSLQKPETDGNCNDDGTCMINVPSPDESNGLISCLFVIVDNNSNETMSNFTSEDLKRANSSNRGIYIAVAIPVSRSMTTHIKLGDGSQSTCNVVETKKDANKKRRKRRQTENDNMYTGRNKKLGEEIYGVYVVSTTPSTPSNDVHLGISPKLSVDNTPAGRQGWSGGPPAYVYAIIAVVVLILIVALAVVFVKKRAHSARKPSEARHGSAPDSNGERVEEVPRPRGSADVLTLHSEPIATVQVNEGSCGYMNFSPRENRSALGSGTSIALSELERRCRAMKLNNNAGFDKEFQKILSESNVYPGKKEAASNPALKKKNRYKNILPFDDTRVKLSGTESGYINACYIDGHNKPKRYIATQGPLTSTVEDFWQMVLEQECRVIVMLSKVYEGGKKKCEKYWPDSNKSARYGQISVENRQEVSYSDYIKRAFSVQSKECVGSLFVYHYQFNKWPDHGVPATTSSLMRMHTAVFNDADQKSSFPLIVHCSAGAGRTGTFIGFDILLNRTKTSDHVDFYNCVLQMRKQRVEMVQNCDQYILVHKLVLEAFMFETRDRFPDELKSMVMEMNSSARAQSMLKREFEDLNKIPPAKDSQSIGLSNMQFNRDRNAVTYNYSRVMFAEEKDGPYINASWLECYDESTKMIATQGPLKSTIEIFWNTVIFKSVSAIVMLTDLMEGKQEACALYWPESGGRPQKFGNITITEVAKETTGVIVERKFKIDKGGEEKTITHFQYAGWKSNQCPDDTKGVIDLVSKMQKVLRSTQLSVALIHCSDGIGRTGAFCTIVNLIDRLKCENRVDVFRAVKDLRDARPNMVKTLEQYKFCYRTVNDYLKSFDLYSNF